MEAKTVNESFRIACETARKIQVYTVVKRIYAPFAIQKDML